MAADAHIRWKELTYPRALWLAEERFGEALALDDEGVRFSFRELAAAAEEASRAFLAAGLERGDRAAIWAPNLWESVVAALGLQSAGGGLVPLNTRYKAAEAGYILAKSRARVLCTMGDFLGTNYADSLAGEELPDLERVVVFRRLAEKYYEELGENAYAIFNACTDYATHSKSDKVNVFADSMQKRIGNWVEEFSEARQMSDFSLENHIGDYGKYLN